MGSHGPSRSIVLWSLCARGTEILGEPGCAVPGSTASNDLTTLHARSYEQFKTPLTRSTYKAFWLKPMYDFNIRMTSDGEPVNTNLFYYRGPGCSGGRSETHMTLMFWQNKPGMHTSVPGRYNHALCVA